MSFIQRFALLVHIAGFLTGLFSALYVYEFLIDEGGDGLTAFILVISPLAGWLLRWLITGELAHFIPLKEYFIKALPLDGNFGIALIMLSIFSFPLLYYVVDSENQRGWEREVFGGCKESNSNEERVLGYFKEREKLPGLLGEYYGEQEAGPIYCSDYLIKDANNETACTWKNGVNASSYQCQKLKENPKPSTDLLSIALSNGVAIIMIFYALFLIRLLNNLRKIK